MKPACRRGVLAAATSSFSRPGDAQLAQPKPLLGHAAPRDGEALDDDVAKTAGSFSGALAPQLGQLRLFPVSPTGRSASKRSPHFLHPNS